MKYLGPVNVIVGNKVTKNGSSISLSQSHYVEKLLRKYNYFDVNPISVPYDPTLNLSKNTT